ncbi:hypothetical protein ACEQ8H_007369 [Pleosporales sp. CAS-2024a]
MATHKRTRTGCWTCRSAGYKCDEQKPFCRRCMRLNIPCKGYTIKLKWQEANMSTLAKKPRQGKKKPFTVTSPGSDASFASTPGNASTSPTNIATSPASTRSLPMASVGEAGIVVDLSASDRWLLQYWVQRLASLLSVTPRRDDVSPFQFHLTAMVHDSLALRSTVLSMAANHLALSSGDGSWKVHAFRHQQNAIRELQGMIENSGMAATEPALATVLMMQVSARLFGEDDEASVANHLAGAKAMIARRGPQESWSAPASTKFLLSLFAYHDILSSVSRGSRPLAEHDTDFVAVEDEPEMQSIAQVLLSVAHISQLQHVIKTRRAASANAALTEEEDATGREIQQSLLKLEAWYGGDHGTSDIHSTFEAYRHAAFIYLYRTWLEVGAPNPISVDHIQRCLQHIHQVDANSPLTSAHIWPLFTAGCEATDASQRQFVRHRFAAMYLSKVFPSLKRIMRDIEDVWSAKDGENQTKGQDGMAKVDCIQVILKRRGREVDLA